MRSRVHICHAKRIKQFDSFAAMLCGLLLLLAAAVQDAGANALDNAYSQVHGEDVNSRRFSTGKQKVSIKL